MHMHIHIRDMTARGEMYLMMLLGVIGTDTWYVQSNIICLRYWIQGLCL